MKIVKYSIVTLILISLLSNNSYSSDEFEEQVIFNKKNEYIITKSCEDIQANMDILLSMYKESDAAIATTWRVSVAKNIPSQTVAAIRLLSKAGVKPQRYCMDPFFETDEITLKTWLGNAINALEVFTMNNGKEELFRCLCLEEIKSEYAELNNKEQ